MEQSIPLGHCRCGACNKVMPVSDWENHIKEPTHQKLFKELYKVIDKKFGIG